MLQGHQENKRYWHSTGTKKKSKKVAYQVVEGGVWPCETSQWFREGSNERQGHHKLAM